jgi:hypothetical protein
VINRAALLLRYKKPALLWINESDPYPDGRELTLDEVNEDRTIYLISSDEAESSIGAEKWVKANFRELFEDELNAWYTDSGLWPSQRTYQLFQQWFDVEVHSMIVDTVGGEIVDDET